MDTTLPEPPGTATLLYYPDYTIVRELGRGGMGVVYEAEQQSTGHRVALKVMKPELAPDSASGERFLREIEIMKGLIHPHVVRLLYQGLAADGTLFITAEYCDGGNIADRMVQQGGKLPLAEARWIMRQILEGLAYIHQARVPYNKLAGGGFTEGERVVHRDLKPHNMLLANSGGGLVAKVGDFGLARAASIAGLSGISASGVPLGTPQFMPRKQLIDALHVGPEVDMYAVAVSLYYMLTGKTPREFPEDQHWSAVIMESQPVPIRERDSTILPQLAAVIDTALVDDDPDLPLRYQSAVELQRDLEAAM